jgi:dethiobiotin synthetase
VSSRRLAIVGTGTGVGKTHVACTLIESAAQLGIEAIGLKPVETGVVEGAADATDQERLWGASQVFHVKRGIDATFHVKRALYSWPDPVSPHLAARRAHDELDLLSIQRWVHLQRAPLAIIETAGGLFSPLSSRLTNFDLVRSLEPSGILLVAPDKLGVLHDLTATLGLAAARGLSISAVALSAPDYPDASTGHNAGELHLLGIASPLAVFPRTSTSAHQSLAAAANVLRSLELGFG